MSIIVDNHIQNDLSVNGPVSFTSKDSHKLSEIHKKDVNISIWERSLDNKIINGAKQILNENPELNLSEVVVPAENLVPSEISHSPDSTTK